MPEFGLRDDDMTATSKLPPLARPIAAQTICALPRWQLRRRHRLQGGDAGQYGVLHDAVELIRKPKCTHRRSSAVKKEFQRTFASMAMGRRQRKLDVEREEAVEQRRLAIEMRRLETATWNLFTSVLEEAKPP